MSAAGGRRAVAGMALNSWDCFLVQGRKSRTCSRGSRKTVRFTINGKCQECGTSHSVSSGSGVWVSICPLPRTSRGTWASHFPSHASVSSSVKWGGRRYLSHAVVTRSEHRTWKVWHMRVALGAGVVCSACPRGLQNECNAGTRAFSRRVAAELEHVENRTVWTQLRE